MTGYDGHARKGHTEFLGKETTQTLIRRAVFGRRGNIDLPYTIRPLTLKASMLSLWPYTHHEVH